MDVNEILIELTVNYFYSSSKDVQKESETTLYCLLKTLSTCYYKIELNKWIEFSINEHLEIRKLISFVYYKLTHHKFINFKEFSSYHKYFIENNLPF